MSDAKKRPTVPQLVGIVAMTKNRVIGKNGDLPWKIPEDLKIFRELTSGHPIIMGRKTFESIGRPLPNRTNIVLTNQVDWSYPGVLTITKLDDLAHIQIPPSDKIFIIGGSIVYSLFKDYLDTIFVSLIRKPYKGDAKFPAFKKDFKFSRLVQEFEEFDLQEYVRKKAQLRLFHYDENSESLKMAWPDDPRRSCLLSIQRQGLGYLSSQDKTSP